jgi:hypothetical protein
MPNWSYGAQSSLTCDIMPVWAIGTARQTAGPLRLSDSATPDRNDGERLKVTYCGFFVAVVRTVAELEQWFALSDLEPETLISRRKRADWPGRARLGRGKPGRARSWTRPRAADRLQIGLAEVGNAGPSWTRLPVRRP